MIWGRPQNDSLGCFISFEPLTLTDSRDVVSSETGEATAVLIPVVRSRTLCFREFYYSMYKTETRKCWKAWIMKCTDVLERTTRGWQMFPVVFILFVCFSLLLLLNEASSKCRITRNHLGCLCTKPVALHLFLSVSNRCLARVSTVIELFITAPLPHTDLTLYLMT